MRSTLTPIRLAAERLRLRLTGLDAGQSELLGRATDTIVNQVDALRRLVDAFGDYARPTSAQLEPVALDALVREVVDLYASGDSGIEFILDLDESGRRPLLDPGRMRQVLHNLIRNAQESHPQGRPRIRVQTRTRQQAGGEWLELIVTDDGPGIPESVRARLFEPYVSTKEKGTGLGLAIVHRIIDEHGGRILAENPEQGGARIRIQLPLDARTAVAPA